MTSGHDVARKCDVRRCGLSADCGVGPAVGAVASRSTPIFIFTEFANTRQYIRDWHVHIARLNSCSHGADSFPPLEYFFAGVHVNYLLFCAQY